MPAVSRIPKRELGRDESVTQYGSTSDSPPFRRHPRPKDLGKVSVIVGRVDSQTASKLVRGYEHEHSCVRFSTVGTLEDAGFVVTHEPSNRNPDHATVHRPDMLADDWSEEVCLHFEECFEEGQINE